MSQTFYIKGPGFYRPLQGKVYAQDESIVVPDVGSEAYRAEFNTSKRLPCFGEPPSSTTPKDVEQVTTMHGMAHAQRGNKPVSIPSRKGD